MTFYIFNEKRPNVRCSIPSMATAMDDTFLRTKGQKEDCPHCGLMHSA